MEAPWYSHQKKVKKMFEKDKDIKVGDVEQFENGDYFFNIQVLNHKKYEALDVLLNHEVQFGNVTLKIYLYDMENNVEMDSDYLFSLYKDLFEGNPICKDMKQRTDTTGTVWSYIRFRPEVLQFNNDDLTDYNLNWSGLAKDIAKEIFVPHGAGVYFCTADLNEKTVLDIN